MDYNTKRLYFGARRTCLEMLRDRGYTVPIHLFQVDLESFKIDEKLLGITEKNGRKVHIFMYAGADKPSEVMKKAKDFVGVDFTVQTTVRVIIIYDAEKVDKLKEVDLYPLVEIFDVHQMFINPTHHIYQPKWRLMNETEVAEILERYEAKMPQTSRVMLGSVCVDDPINRYYGGKPASRERRGDVYEITRDGTSIFYRKVVAKKMNLKT